VNGPGNGEPTTGGQPETDEAADDELISRLRRIAAEADPLPEALISAARAAFALRDVDARVAELVRDSVLDAPVTAMRGGDTRMLSFEAGDTVIECEVTVHAGGHDVKGQLSGGEAALVEAQVAGTPPVDVDVRPHGFFSVRGLPSGPFRLRCRMANGATIATSWTSV
jgi:hypothetical protein